MKRVLIVRHAKSSQDLAGIKDIDRPLNERGKKDAPEMAGRLATQGIVIDAFISSPAKRARKTAEAFVQVFGGHKNDLVIEPSLYLADVQEFYNVLTHLPEEWNTVAVFSHNPGITAFANSLTTTRIDNMPTCAVFAVTSNASWKDLGNASCDFWFFDYPKNTAS